MLGIDQCGKRRLRRVRKNIVLKVLYKLFKYEKISLRTRVKKRFKNLFKS